VGGPRTWRPFTGRQQGWTDALLPRKSAPNTTMEAVRLSQAPADDRLLVLRGPYHQHTINMFNTCSRVLTPRSLIDIGGGYHIEILK
jgi:hypothetical protein